MTQKSNERTPFGYPTYKDQGRTIFILFNGIPMAISGVARATEHESTRRLTLHAESPPQKGTELQISTELIRFRTHSRAEFELYIGRSLHGLDQVTLEILSQAFTCKTSESPLAFLMLHIASRMHDDVGTNQPGAQVRSQIDIYGGMGMMVLGIPKVGPGGSTNVFRPQQNWIQPGEAPRLSDLDDMIDEETGEDGNPPLPFSHN